MTQRLAFAALCLLATTSCVVSKKKFDAMELAKLRCDSSYAALDQRFVALDKKFINLDKQYKDLDAQHKSLISEAVRLRKDTAGLGKAGRDFRDKLNRLSQDYSALMASSANDAASLNKALVEKQKSLSELEKTLLTSREMNDKLATDLKAREARVNELEKILADQEKAVKALREKVQKALLNFKDSELTVNLKNGKVYVSLAEQLLFKSGKFDVDSKGQQALKQLAAVLKSDPEINVMVEGHTDDVPLVGNSASFKDNWDLSVLRATAITRLLSQEGVGGVQLIAAGRSEYLPLDATKTREARTKNRRTEIILTPKLDELFQILGN